MTAPRCDDNVYPRGMRVAGGFPCPNPAKGVYRVESRWRWACGIHLSKADRDGHQVVRFVVGLPREEER